MRTLCAVLCLLLASYIHADLMDSLVSEALRIKSLIRQTSESKHDGQQRAHAQAFNKVVYPQKVRQKQLTQRKAVASNLISRKRFFPENNIKKIYVSPSGDKFAYIARSRGFDRIHIMPVRNEGSFANIINDNVSVKSMVFAGNDALVYSFYDENNYLKLMSVNLITKQRRNITPVENAKSIRIINGKRGAIITITYDGARYFTHKIDVLSGANQLIKEDNIPLMALFDDNLQPALYYKNIVGKQSDVFVNTQQIDGTKGEKRIDHLTDITKEKYISINGTHCYKLKNIGGKVELWSVNLRSGQTTKISITGASVISDCKINFDKNNAPMFATVFQGRTVHGILDGNSAAHIEKINNAFKNSDWFRINTTADGNIWLICVNNAQKPDRYYLYDMRTSNLKYIATSNDALKDEKLRPTISVKIPAKDGTFFHGYLTKAIKHSSKTPLIIMLNSGGKHRYNWEFLPLVQLLADRGLSVLCLNYRTNKGEKDLIAAAKWCLNNNIAERGNISIIAKKNSCLSAMQSFLKNQNSFAGCVLLSVPEAVNEMILSESLQKPLLVINNIINSRTINRASAGHAPVTYIGYNQKLSNELSAGLIEQFFSKVYKVRGEKISAREASAIITLLDGFNLIHQLDDSYLDSEEDSTVYDML